MRLRLRVKEFILYLIIVVLLSFNTLIINASAFLDFNFEGTVGTAILVTLICLIALIVGIIIYLKYYRKKRR